MARAVILFLFLAFLTPMKSFADCRNIGFFVLRSSAVEEKTYTPFIESDCIREGELAFGDIDYNPLTANQQRDLDNMVGLIKELSVRATRGIVVLAYSETGKFAAKLAALDAQVKGLFLMDPVDGTPPFSSPKKFPIFLDEKFPTLTIPTVVMESELGPQFKRLGHSCVPENMGPDRFYKHISTDSLKRVFLKGFGHADFLLRRGFNLVELMCGTGIYPKEDAFAVVLEEWKAFVDHMQSLL
jgi:pimeloyl-ACP methyl ester carboxylesterase